MSHGVAPSMLRPHECCLAFPSQPPCCCSAFPCMSRTGHQGATSPLQPLWEPDWSHWSFPVHHGATVFINVHTHLLCMQVWARRLCRGASTDDLKVSGVYVYCSISKSCAGVSLTHNVISHRRLISDKSPNLSFWNKSHQTLLINLPERWTGLI